MVVRRRYGRHAEARDAPQQPFGMIASMFTGWTMHGNTCPPMSVHSRKPERTVARTVVTEPFPKGERSVRG